MIFNMRISMFFALGSALVGTKGDTDTEECQAGDCLNFLQTPIKAHDVQLSEDLEESLNSPEILKEAATIMQEMSKQLQHLKVDAFVGKFKNSMLQIAGSSKSDTSLEDMKQELNSPKTQAALIKHVQDLQAHGAKMVSTDLVHRVSEELQSSSMKPVLKALKRAKKTSTPAASVPGTINKINSTLAKYGMTGAGLLMGLAKSGLITWLNTKIAGEKVSSLTSAFKLVSVTWKFLTWDGLLGGYAVGSLLELVLSAESCNLAVGILVSFAVAHVAGLWQVLANTVMMKPDQLKIYNKYNDGDFSYLNDAIVKSEDWQWLAGLLGMLVGWGTARATEVIMMNRPCTVVGDKPCVFPFTFKNVNYTDCAHVKTDFVESAGSVIVPWCMTGASTYSTCVCPYASGPDAIRPIPDPDFDKIVQKPQGRN